MGKWVSIFNTLSEFATFSGTTGFSTPHTTLIHQTDEVIFVSDTRVVTKYNVTSTSSPTRIGYNAYISGFSAIEIDGVAQPSVVSSYTFSTTGIHTVKYTLTDMTSIGERAFYDCSGLTSIKIPNSVTSIGNSAFYYCTSLSNITIPNSVTTIGNSVFFFCSSLTSIDIPSGVTSINTDVFRYCRSLTNITIPNSVTSISSNAFANCSGLTSIVIPNSVTSIGVQAFGYCSGLTSITSNATTAPNISNQTFRNVKTNGTLYVPNGSTGYDTWMQNANYYLGLYNWTKVER